jgi:chemotaxis protein MotB
VAGGGHNRRRRRHDHAHDEHPDERWLLTYADMITLLMALFIVMWAMSSVNISKFQELKKSLKQAFAGQVMEGGSGVLNGGTQVLEPEGARIQENSSHATPQKTLNEKFSRQGGATGDQNATDSGLAALQRQVEKYAKSRGLQRQIGTKIDERGLVVRLLTDKVLFDPGHAYVKPEARPILGQIAVLIKRLRIKHPIRVEGNTDSTPIHTAQFPSNWELSTARATAVLQVLRGRGVPERNLSAAGYADQRPVATNRTVRGRYMNRHVDIVVLRDTGVEKGTP